MEHRRVVVFCVLLSNLMTQIPPLFMALTSGQPVVETLLWASLNGVYYALLAVAALAPGKRVVIAALSTAIVFVVGATIVFSALAG